MTNEEIQVLFRKEFVAEAMEAYVKPEMAVNQVRSVLSILEQSMDEYETDNPLIALFWYFINQDYLQDINARARVIIAGNETPSFKLKQIEKLLYRLSE